MPKYVLYAGVSYTVGTMNYPEVECLTVEDLTTEIGKIVTDEADALSLTFTVQVNEGNTDAEA